MNEELYVFSSPASPWCAVGLLYILLATFMQGRIKGFVGPKHFPLLGPFEDSKIIVGTIVYSRLSGLMEGEGIHG
jgi:hypothetical protein